MLCPLEGWRIYNARKIFSHGLNEEKHYEFSNRKEDSNLHACGPGGEF